MNPKKTPELPDFADLFKEFADAMHETAAQMRLAQQCKMRRFYAYRGGEEVGIGVVFPDGTTIAQEYVTGTLYNCDDPKRAMNAGFTLKYVDAENKQ